MHEPKLFITNFFGKNCLLELVTWLVNTKNRWADKVLMNNS